MRRSWITTEFLSTLAALALFIGVGLVANVRINILAGVLTALLVSIMMNRAWFKRDRAFFDEPAVKGSGEFIALLLNYGILLTFILQFGLSAEIGILLMAGGQVAYVLTRGWAKRNTIRPARI